jgi:hypothetical protein
MGFYPQTIAAVKSEIQKGFGAVEVNERGLEANDLPGYLLWMIREVERWSRETPSAELATEAAVKAASWMGYVLRGMEELGLWDNARSRELIRADKKTRSHLATINPPPA